MIGLMVRAVLSALLYIVASGCQWRLLPEGFPPYSTVQRFFYAWRQTAPGSGSTTPL
jgi:putative transposase